MKIRRAVPADLDAITEIYNEAIRTTTATFDTQPKSRDQQVQWLESHDEKHPVLVAECDGQITGWASLSRWSDRPAYDLTAETSFYVKREHRGRGIGRKLKEATIETARRLGFHVIIAQMAEGSDASIHLNRSLGFEYVGVLKEVGHKFGRRLDVHIYQMML